jgi:proton-translocating NADH-quinone oxidoreductase chain L
MLFVVTFISTLVHLYSTEYMSEDPHLPRFMSYLSLFTFFMLMLVTSNNFLQMFVGWEGVGLSSYLLINFWFTRIQANKAAIKAMLVNRVGDFFILCALFGILYLCGSLEYDVVFSTAPYMADLAFKELGYSFPVLDMICIALFLGAMGKSAQLGLHTWLPDAMEGPTPVSALIHAATMVTAGVFLLARCSYLFELSPTALLFIQFVGSCTAIFAASTGLFQNDMKKVIAYSTCSQLGYMVFAAGLSNYDVSMFHLSNHAFFKALLFLAAGSVIHAVADEQDMRKMGGLKKLLPFSYSVVVIGSLALIGFPFLAGFYSKDIILEAAFAKNSVTSHFCFYLGTFAAFFTAFYSTRLLFLVFLAEPNGNKITTFGAHEPSWRMSLPLFLLAIFSITVGFFAKDIFIGFGSDFWDYSIFMLSQNYSLRDIEFISTVSKLTPLVFTLLGTFMAYYIYAFALGNVYSMKQTPFFQKVYNFLSRKWYFDRLYNEFITQSVLNYSLYGLYINIDRGMLEKSGPSGSVSAVRSFTKELNVLQSGNVKDYLLLFLIGMFGIVFLIYCQTPVLTFAFFASFIFNLDEF